MLEVDTDNFEHNARGWTRTMLGVDMDNFGHDAGGGRPDISIMQMN